MSRLILVRGAISTLALCAACAGVAPEPQFRLIDEDGPARAVELTGMSSAALEGLRETSDAELQRALQVFAGSLTPEEDPRPAIDGRVTVDGRVLRFDATYPIASDLALFCRFDGEPRREAVLRSAAVSDRSTTRVSRVYPDVDRLPANTLRLYVEFSAPMRTTRSLDFIELRHDGHVVTEAFVDVETGMWGPRNQRLTLLFHPGRIKRNVGPNVRLGPPLLPGERYELSISDRMLDANGQGLIERYTKTFEVVGSDREALDPEEWKIFAPSADTREALTVRVGEPLDHALAQRMITLYDRNRRPVPGTASLIAGQTTWRFLPDRVWQAGRYVLSIDPQLEDLAGNTPLAVFDVPANAETPAPAVLELPVRIADPSGSS